MEIILICGAVIIGVVAIIFAVTLGQRLYHNRQRKHATINTYAIQNVKTGMDIRPYNAGIADDVKIIQYKHKNWECMTWQFIKMEDGSYLLKNLYTHMTFQPIAVPESEMELYQKHLEANALQYWEFEQQKDDTYLIRVRGTKLYATASSEDNNAAVILKPLENSDLQKWCLIEQHPTV